MRAIGNRALLRRAGAAVCALALIGCEGPRAAPHAYTVTDSAGIRITRIEADPARLDEWTLAPSPRFVITGLESGDSAAFAPVGGVQWLASRDIVISDVGANRLLVYDAAGTFQRALGRVGDGPGEFRRIGALSSPGGDTVAVFDASHRALSYWHAATGYLRRVSVSDGESLDAWPADAWAWRDSRIVVLQLATTPLDSVPPSTGLRKWPMRARLTLRDSTGTVLARSPQFAGMYTGLLERGDMRVVFSNNPFAAVGREVAYYGSGETFALSSVNTRFDSVGVVRWPALQEPVTDAEVTALRAERAAAVAGLAPPERIERMLDQEFAPELLPPVRPAIGRVLVDATDRIWVERFEPPRLGTRAQVPGILWHVLALDGRPIARLRLPPRTRLEAVRGTEVLVMQRDSLDVERVALYPLVQP